MGVCELCGKKHDNSFDIVHYGQRHTFDSFECAIHALAPVCCAECGCRIIGNGVESDGSFFCSSDCAEQICRPVAQ